MGICESPNSNIGKENSIHNKYKKSKSLSDIEIERKREVEQIEKNDKNLLSPLKTKKTSNKDITTNQLAINNDVIISKNEANLEKIYKKIKKMEEEITVKFG